MPLKPAIKAHFNAMNLETTKAEYSIHCLKPKLNNLNYGTNSLHFDQSQFNLPQTKLFNRIISGTFLVQRYRLESNAWYFP